MKLQIHTSAPLSVWLGISDMQQSCKPLQALESNLLNERVFVWLANLTKLSFDNDCPIPSSKAIWMARCKCSGQELKAQPKGPAVIDVQELGTVVNTYLNRHHPGRFFHLNQKGNKWVFPNTGEVLRWTWSSQGWKNLFGSLQITYPKVIERLTGKTRTWRAEPWAPCCSPPWDVFALPRSWALQQCWGGEQLLTVLGKAALEAWNPACSSLCHWIFIDWGGEPVTTCHKPLFHLAIENRHPSWQHRNSCENRNVTELGGSGGSPGQTGWGAEQSKTSSSIRKPGEETPTSHSAPGYPTRCSAREN